MRRNIIVLIVLSVAVVLIGACAQYGKQQATTQLATAPLGNAVEMTADAFTPNTLTINAGDTVTWTNKDTNAHWPASAMHPTHEVYPETGGCIGSTFDACKEIAPGESWSFTFNQAGSWKYHDHLNPAGPKGTIVVQ